MSKVIIVFVALAVLLVHFFTAKAPIVFQKSVIIDSKEIAAKYTVGNEEALVNLRSAVLKGGRPLRLVSYNVHKCKGLDARTDPGRIADVIRSLDADLVSLQEVRVERGDTPSEQLLTIAQKTGMYIAIGESTVHKKDGDFGNALLSRFPITGARFYTVGVGRFETRGIIDADVELGGNKLRVIATHLGIRPAERSMQTDWLLKILSENHNSHFLVMGDFNSWNPFSTTVGLLQQRLGKPLENTTYPAVLPILSLDKIWASTNLHITKMDPRRIPQARYASDHLPIAADLDLRSLLR